MTILYNIVYALLCLCLDAANFPLIIACFSCRGNKQKIVAFLHSQFNFSTPKPEVFYNFPQIFPLNGAFTKVLYMTFLII